MSQSPHDSAYEIERLNHESETIKKQLHEEKEQRRAAERLLSHAQTDAEQRKHEFDQQHQACLQKQEELLDNIKAIEGALGITGGLGESVAHIKKCIRQLNRRVVGFPSEPQEVVELREENERLKERPSLRRHANDILDPSSDSAGARN